MKFGSSQMQKRFSWSLSYAIYDRKIPLIISSKTQL